MYIEIEREDGGGAYYLNTANIAAVYIGDIEGESLQAHVVTTAPSQDGMHKLKLKGWEAEQLIAAVESNAYSPAREGEMTS